MNRAAPGAAPVRRQHRPAIRFMVAGTNNDGNRDRS